MCGGREVRERREGGMEREAMHNEGDKGKGGEKRWGK